MGKTNYLLVNRKDQKKIEDLKHILSVLGIDLDQMASDLEHLYKENAELSKKNKALEDEISHIKEERAREKEEIENYISSSMKKVEENVAKKTSEVTGEIQKEIKTYIFKGSKIDENY